MLISENFVMDTYGYADQTYGGIGGYDYYAEFYGGLPSLIDKIHFKHFSVERFEIEYVSHYSPYMEGLQVLASDWWLASSLDWSGPNGESIVIDSWGGDLVCHYLNGCYIDETNGFNQEFADNAEDLLTGFSHIFKAIPIFDSMTPDNYNYEGTYFNYKFSAVVHALPVYEASSGVLLSLALLGVSLIKGFKQRSY